MLTSLKDASGWLTNELSPADIHWLNNHNAGSTLFLEWVIGYGLGHLLTDDCKMLKDIIPEIYYIKVVRLIAVWLRRLAKGMTSCL